MNVEGNFFNANVEGNNRNAFDPVRGRGSSKLWPGPYHSMATYLRYVGASGLAMVPVEIVWFADSRSLISWGREGEPREIKTSYSYYYP